MKTGGTPWEIESESMEIVESYMKEFSLPPLEKAIVKRVIHSTADPSLAENLIFNLRGMSPDPTSCFTSGLDIYTDVNMLKAGVSPKLLKNFHGKVHCLIDAPEVAEEAKQQKITRAAAAMYRHAENLDGALVAIGNAPTALFALLDLVERKVVRPLLVVGIPVGFVGAAESKEKLARFSDLPHVTLSGRRGGSPVAAAVVNALLGYQKEVS